METVLTVLTHLTFLHLVKGSITNVAKSKPASMSSNLASGFNAATAVDGNTNAAFPNGIIHTDPGQPSAWWKVDLERDVQDATVEIYFRTDYSGRRNGVQIYTSITPFSSYPEGQLCYTVTGDPSGSDIDDVVSVTCPGRWRYLLVYTKTDNNGQGPVLDFGEVMVLACSDGTYGENCTKTCNARYCVTMNATCDRDGKCPDGCQTGWTGVDCRQALPPCQSGLYGLNCTKQCSERHCKESSTSSCDRLTGACPDGCKPGWREIDCTLVCDSNFYGSGCSSLCSNRKCLNSASSCDHVTGMCVGGCQSGYNGTDCVLICDSNFYGSGCSLLCSNRKCLNSASSCDHVTGLCVGGCQSGYSGTDCVLNCSPGTYGSRCSQLCSDRHCLSFSASCNSTSGSCDGDCRSGWRGTDCTQVCQTGMYGVNCMKSCSSRHCVTPSSECDRQTGQCIGGCQEGWRGVDCVQECPAGTFGVSCTSCSTRHCQGDSDCPADGRCSQGCQDGWTLTTCTQACPSGSYGPGCNKTCGHCIGDNICNHVTGNCPGDCQDGWEGHQCQQVCPPGKYGMNCVQNCGQCNGTCDVVDGHCPAGCLEGYCGQQCKNKLTVSDGGVPVTTVVGAVVGAVVGSVLVVVLVNVGIHLCLIRQGRLQWVKVINKDKSNQNTGDNTQMRNLGQGHVSDTEHAHSSYAYNNDYAELNAETQTGNKDYDVIQQKHYQNT